MKQVLLLIGAFLCIQNSFSAESFYAEKLIFPLQDKHVHASSIVECPNGDLLATWFHGTGERTATDVVIKGARLKSGSKQWSEVFPMADTPEIPDCNPVLFIDQKDELWLFWIAVLADRWEDSILRYRKAKDYQKEGEPKWYWQDMIVLKPGERFADVIEKGFEDMNYPEIDFGSYAPHPLESIVEASKNSSFRQRGWMTRNHINVLPDGRILIPLYSDGFYVSLMAISDNHGQTWRASEPIVGVGLNQPTIVQKKDGTLVAYMRDEGPAPKRVQMSISNDRGERWSVATDTEIPNPDTSLEVIALHNGNWLMVYNDLEEGRDSLALALSNDEGQTWKTKKNIEKLSGGLFHYPSMIQTKDGLIHISYTYQPGSPSKRTIKHVTINEEWIYE